MSLENINWYSKIPKSYLQGTGRTYPNQKKINIDIPFRMLLIGCAGAGKNNTLMNLINHMNCFNKFYIFAKNTDQPLYNFLVDKLKKVAEKMDIDEDEIFMISDNLDDIPELEEFNREINNLVIIDDFVSEKVSNLKTIEDLFSRSRPFNVSVMFLSQSFFKIPKFIRQNADYIILKRINQKKDLKLIINEYFPDDQEKILQVYDKATHNNNNSDFVLLDCKTSNDNLRYRLNYG